MKMGGRHFMYVFKKNENQSYSKCLMCSFSYLHRFDGRIAVSNCLNRPFEDGNRWMKQMSTHYCERRKQHIPIDNYYFEREHNQPLQKCLRDKNSMFALTMT